MGSTVASSATWPAIANPAAICGFFALNAVVWWIVTLAHELGHAVVGLTRTEGLVVVQAGRSSPKWRRRFGRLELELGPVPILSGGGGIARIHAGVGRTTRVLLAVAGPAAGCLAAALLFLLGSSVQFRPLQVIAAVALAFDLANLIPFRLRGFRSDGAYLLQALRGRAPSVDEGDAVASRWLVLATDPRAAFAARDRDIYARLNDKMRRAKADQDSEAMAIHQLTFAGWCWRRAEQGDTTPIREFTLDARHRATRPGLGRANIIAAAAGQLVRERMDFESGSPTADSLERGFERAHANARYSELPDGKARVAFCFGVAMHDVATIAG